MKEYLVQWNPTCVDELNRRVPDVLKDVTFELEKTALPVRSSDGGIFEIEGQSLVKIIVDYSDKDYFVHKLKAGTELDGDFPRYLADFIANKLQIYVF